MKMKESEFSDFSDDSDYAYSQSQGSASLMNNESSSTSGIEEEDVVYLKENVSIHQTQYAAERISGRLKLIKQGGSIFMTWIPYKGRKSNANLSEKDRNLYTIRAVSLTDIRSIRRHTPPFGWQYVIVVLSSGLAFPPLYFYNGGVRDFLAAIKKYVLIVRSAEDANVFIVNDFQDPLQRTLSSLDLPGIFSVANGQSTIVSTAGSLLHNTDGVVVGSSGRKCTGRQRGKIHDPARDISVQVLQKFSLVTKFARETTSQLFRDNHSDVYSGEQSYLNQSSDHYPQKTSVAAPEVPEQIQVSSDPFEKTPCMHENSGEEATTNVGTFQIIDCKEFDKLSLVWGKPRQPPLGSEEWATFLDTEGRVMDSKALMKRIFYGGLDHRLRKEVWAFLLGYHTCDSTYAEREYLCAVKKSEYEAIKIQWQNISPEQARRFTKFRERKGLIDKDVVRTDRSLPFYDGEGNANVSVLRDILLTYSFYNFDLGYCQGMSDLLSPILFVMKDESESFWCFVALMERLGPNFNRDQTGMHSQLFALSKLVELLDGSLHNYFQQNDCLNYFFCFRWLLIQFKREFEYERTMRLWEVLWTHYLSEHFHLYVCVAILKRYSRKIIGDQMDFDTLLKFINELSGHIDLDTILRDAEALCICAGENGEALIPPGTPPSLPVENGSVYTQLDDEVL